MTAPFSVFLPVYNEEELLVTNVERLRSHLQTFNTPFEIFIGSNGSTDRTVELGRALAQKHPDVTFFHGDRRGPGLAFGEALQRIKTPLLLCLDADLSTDLSFVAKALEELTRYEIVIGSKKSGTESRGYIRTFGSDVFIFCSKLLLQLPFDDYSLGAKAYRVETLKPYASYIDRWSFFVQNIVYHAHKDGHRIIQIPILCQDFRRSKFSTAKIGSYRFQRLFRLWLENLRSKTS